METKHTPGPWDNHQRDAAGNFIFGTARRCVGAVFSDERGISDEEAEANFALIAAAPDLLAALQALSDAARTAIAKAKGR